jgi:hypothetical protein
MIMMLMMMMKIDALASNDPTSGDDGSPSTRSPSESLSEVRFQCFLVAMCLASQIHLHGVNIFDEAI